jgi:hypothetical protein
MRGDFESALETYRPSDDIQIEFPHGDAVFLQYKNGVPSFVTVFQDIARMLIKYTAEGLDPGAVEVCFLGGIGGAICEYCDPCRCFCPLSPPGHIRQ